LYLKKLSYTICIGYFFVRYCIGSYQSSLYHESVVSPRSLTAKSRVQVQASPCGIFDRVFSEYFGHPRVNIISPMLHTDLFVYPDTTHCINLRIRGWGVVNQTASCTVRVSAA